MKNLITILTIMLAISAKCIAQNDSIFNFRKKIIIENNNSVSGKKSLELSNKDAYLYSQILYFTKIIPRAGKLLISFPVENISSDTIVLERFIAGDGVSIGYFPQNNELKFKSPITIDSLIIPPYRTRYICLSTLRELSDINFHVNAHLDFYCIKNPDIDRQVPIGVTIKKRKFD